MARGWVAQVPWGKAALAALGVAALAAAGLRSLVRHDPHLVRGVRPRAVVYTMCDVAEEPVRVLRQGGVFQSATYTGARRFQPVFAYIRAFDRLFEAGVSNVGNSDASERDVLMLGGGAFSYPKHVLTAHEGVRLDVVEYCPAAIDAARRWFFLDELEECLARADTAHGNSLRIFTDDARSFLERGASLDGEAPCSDGSAPHGQCGRARYDAIINDTFSGAAPVVSMATVEAARAVRRRLAPGGLYLSNVVSRDAGRDVSFLRDEVATLCHVFSNVQVIPVSDDIFGGEDNYLVIATDADLVFTDAIPYDEDFLGTPLHDDGKGCAHR